MQGRNGQLMSATVVAADSGQQRSIRPTQNYPRRRYRGYLVYPPCSGHFLAQRYPAPRQPERIAFEAC